MKWKNDYNKEWRKVFALFPQNIDGVTVWLSYYWKRYVVIEKSGCCPSCHVIAKWELSLTPPDNQ